MHHASHTHTHTHSQGGVRYAADADSLAVIACGSAEALAAANAASGALINNMFRVSEVMELHVPGLDQSAACLSNNPADSHPLFSNYCNHSHPL